MLKGCILQQRFRRERIVAPQTRRNLSVERPGIDDDKPMFKLHKELKMSVEKDNRDKRNPDYDMLHLSEKRKSARKADNFGGDSILGPYDDKDALRSKYMLLLYMCRYHTSHKKKHICLMKSTPPQKYVPCLFKLDEIQSFEEICNVCKSKVDICIEFSHYFNRPIIMAYKILLTHLYI